MSFQVSENLSGVGKAIAQTFGDLEAAQNESAKFVIQNFLKVVEGAVEAKKAGLTEEFYLGLLKVVNGERDRITDGEIEITGAVTTGLETADGKSFNVSFSAGGSLAGFSLQGSAGYTNSSSRTYREQTSQNFRILARWVTVPKGTDPELLKLAVQFAFRLPDGVKVPDVLTATPSPSTTSGGNDYLDALNKIIPALFKTSP